MILSFRLKATKWLFIAEKALGLFIPSTQMEVKSK